MTMAIAMAMTTLMAATASTLIKKEEKEEKKMKKEEKKMKKMMKKKKKKRRHGLFFTWLTFLQAGTSGVLVGVTAAVASQAPAGMLLTQSRPLSSH